MTVQERREKLLEWMITNRWFRPQRLAVLAFDFAGGSFDQATIGRDLRALEREGRVRRLPGRPARWEAV